MFTKKLEDQFSADLLNTVKGILGEAKKCPKDCECEKCEKEDDEEEDDKEEMKEGKRGLWDNIHAKRKRIKAGSGERMRKPGSEGAPTNADFKAASEGVMPTADEPSAKDKKVAQKIRDMMAKEKKPVKEDSEQIDELSKPTMGRYINKAKDSIDMASYRQGHKEAHGSSSKPLEKKLTKRHKGIETAVGKLTKEESEQIDELSKDTMGRYINKAATKMGSQGVTAGLKIAADEKSSKNFKDMGKREKGIKLAVNKLTKEEQDFIDSLNDADLEQIDELSKKTLGSYVKKASGAEQPKNVMSPKNVPLTKIAAYQGDSETGHFGKRFNQATYDKAERLRKNRSQGITRAADKLAKEEVEIAEGVTNPEIKKAYADLLKTPGGSSERKAAVRHYKSLRQNAVKEEADMWHVKLNGKRVSKHFDSEDRAKKFAEYGSDTKKGKWSVHKSMAEEVGLEEGRGRPPKEGSAAWHAKQNQASDDMVALGMQLRKAKSMNKKVRFMDNKEHEISANHADRFEDHMAARRTTQEKAAFQKQAHKSHADFVKAVSAPVPKSSKDTGEIVRYRH